MFLRQGTHRGMWYHVGARNVLIFWVLCGCLFSDHLEWLQSEVHISFAVFMHEYLVYGILQFNIYRQTSLIFVHQRSYTNKTYLVFAFLSDEASLTHCICYNSWAPVIIDSLFTPDFENPWRHAFVITEILRFPFGYLFHWFYTTRHGPKAYTEWNMISSVKSPEQFSHDPRIPFIIVTCTLSPDMKDPVLCFLPAG